MPSQTRRGFLKCTTAAAASLSLSLRAAGKKPTDQPNILLAISDDQSWPHASAYGCRFAKTPTFDRIAKEGVLFDNAFTPAPQCSPCRAAILTGRNPWQNREAAVHNYTFPADLRVYTILLEQSGYHVGMSGKGWGPGSSKGWPNNPAGKVYRPKGSKRRAGYAREFQAFLQARKPGQPFCFWFGSYDPHRGYAAGSGLKAGKTLESVDVPGFLPDHKSVRSDMLDYAVEIERFDRHLGEMIDILEGAGELDNTLIVVTSDNGMPFTRAKANVYEYGVHMPLAVRWGAKVPAGRRVTDLVSLIDLAPTFLEAASLAVPKSMTGRSLMNVLTSSRSGRVDQQREWILVGRERHTGHSRPNNWGYSSRAIRTERYLYIRNFTPDRWPEGDTLYDGGPSSSRTLLIERCEDPAMQRYIRLAWAKRPAEELYDIAVDLDCIKNLAAEATHGEVTARLRARLDSALRQQDDPRIADNSVFDQYDREGSKGHAQRRQNYLKEVSHLMDVMGWREK